MEFKDKLKELRQGRGMSQQELATRLGKYYQDIGQWEKGLKKPGFDNIVLLCQVFNVSADWLLGLTD